MPIRCPHCGAYNRDTARFCSVCGGQMPSPQPPPPSLQHLPQLPFAYKSAYLTDVKTQEV